MKLHIGAAGRMPKPQVARVQRLPFKAPQLLGQLRRSAFGNFQAPSVNGVAYQRVPLVQHMNPYLMRAPGFQTHCNESMCRKTLQNAEMCHRRAPGTRHRHSRAVHPVPADRRINAAAGSQAIIADSTILTPNFALLKIAR